MSNLVSWLTGSKDVERKESEGLNLAVQTIEEFKERTFRCRQRRTQYSGISSEELREFVQEQLPDYYSYTTRIKKYVDRKGIPQAKIEIIGKIGLSRQLNRYNPLDRTFCMATENSRVA